MFWRSVVLLVFITAHSSYASAQELLPAQCWCPQTSKGWMLYDDINPVPDFFDQDKIEVREILICTHGIHFFFFTTQNGREYYTSLIIVKPTIQLYAIRKPPRNRKLGCLTLEDRLKRGLERYEWVMGELERVLGDAFGKKSLIQFEDELSPPIICPPKGLILRWKERELKIRGYLDVYLSVLS